VAAWKNASRRYRRLLGMALEGKIQTLNFKEEQCCELDE
jgi:hypothetical protein